ncbi:hypothetical protein HAX54_003000 [Datura stramonium]|uniref:PITH domain-containing protein n=1 Tax=Datura stramonium TaxID=4076 RepID=A0ABS8T4R4_DATST|nr:hypothetical protein [Datura stramonium]
MSAESASAIPKGQVDLLDFIDWSGVECLNQSGSHTISNALKQVKKNFCILSKLGLFMQDPLFNISIEEFHFDYFELWAKL